MEVYKPSLNLPLGRVAIIVFSLVVCYYCILRIGESNPLYFAGIISSIAGVIYQVRMFKIGYYMNSAITLDLEAMIKNVAPKE